ncbi:hypothetical protein AB1A96_10755, partial [Pseudomonas juntendi]|uniref:hypothetical protein n=1 Tax=Pseudomonas juntendi TaxID=2666183 RepID=UPI003454E72B
PERNRERSIGHQVDAWNVGMMDPLRINRQTMPSSLESAFQASAARINHFIEVHRGNPGTSFSEHIKRRRREKVAHASSFTLIYLDTLAWKCLADYRQGKPTLTEAMKEFGASIEQAVQTGRFAFPIGLPTYYELASMTDPLTQGTLRILVDELSQGVCIPPHHDRVGLELESLRTEDISQAQRLDAFLCSPIEMMGVPMLSLPTFVTTYVDQTTFNKAFFDALLSAIHEPHLLKDRASAYRGISGEQF